MKFKIIGLLLTLLSGLLLSVSIRKRYDLRIQMLEALLEDFQMIKSQVDFLRTEMPEIFFHLKENSKGALKQFYERITEELKSGASAAHAFSQAVEQSYAALALTPKDAEILMDFAATLGQTDYENQMERIAATKELLSFQRNEALCRKEKNQKAHCAIALCGTAALGIILL